MTLTHDFNELVQKRIARDPAFGEALLREGVDEFLEDEDIGPTTEAEALAAVEAYNRIFFVDGLIGYLDVRQWAFEKLRSCPIASNLIDLRMYHSLYFTNLFGAVDWVSEYLKTPAEKKAFEDRLKQGFAKPGDFEYARELRNSIVHRGLDPAALGTQVGARVFALCPAVVFHRSGKKGHLCSFPLLADLAAACNKASDLAIQAVLEGKGFLDADVHTPNKAQTLEAVAAAPHMPDWAKSMATEAFETMNFEVMAADLAQGRIRHLRALLGNSAPGTLPTASD